jgi:hypothetical protein
MENVSCHEFSNSATILRSPNNSRLITKIISFFCAFLLIVTYQPMTAFAKETIHNQSEQTKIYAKENNQTNEITIYNDKDNGTVEKVLAGTVAGGVAGGAASIAIVSAAGTAGLSAAGISSGLATMGALVGGGMAAGLAVSAALPVLAAAGAGFAIYEGVKAVVPKKEKPEERASASQTIIIQNN